MPLYESVFIARQDISTTQVDDLTENFEKIITDQGGAVKKTEQWGLRTLAYKIKKNRKGYYVLFNIDAPSDAIHEMERLMHINDDVLRFLTTRVEELEEGPSAVLRARDRDDDRGRRGGRDFDRKPDFAKKPDATGEKPADAADKKPADATDKKPADAADKKPADAADKKPADAADKKPADAADKKPADAADKKPADAADKASDAAEEKASDAVDKASDAADKEGEDK